MGRTLENKQQIVGELKELLGEAEMALVLDYQGLSIREMKDLRSRLAASNGVWNGLGTANRFERIRRPSSSTSTASTARA